VLKLLKKRLFSSPQAFLNTLNRHRASLRKSARYEALTRSTGALARIFEQAEEDYSDDVEQQEAELEALEAAARAFRPPSATDTQILNDLAAWAERATAQLDSKADKLIRWLESVVRPNGPVLFGIYEPLRTNRKSGCHEHRPRAMPTTSRIRPP
jgi:hypothetical protein